MLARLQQQAGLGGDVIAADLDAQVEAARLHLGAHGYAHVPQADDRTRHALAGSLGELLHVEQVRARPESRALVTSTRALGPHTDHHAARFILWTCLKQSKAGGESILVDGLAVAHALPEAQREALERVVLFEHRVFDGDADEHPMLWHEGGRWRLYYSFWLAKDDMSGEPRAAFEAFSAALQIAPQIRLRLQPGDLLVVDNHRMLHGRTAIDGERHLVRWWLGTGDPGSGKPRQGGC